MTTKIDIRAEWIRANADALRAARAATSDHAACKGDCHNGRTCHCQSGPGWGFWARAFATTGVPCDATSYWAGSNPTPSTSINKGMAEYIRLHAPALAQ